jgi:hypothetical protein
MSFSDRPDTRPASRGGSYAGLLPVAYFAHLTMIWRAALH